MGFTCTKSVCAVAPLYVRAASKAAPQRRMLRNSRDRVQLAGHTPLKGSAMPAPIHINRELSDDQKSKLRRGVLFPVLVFLATIAVLVAGTYYTATNVDRQQQTTGEPTLDQNAPRR